MTRIRFQQSLEDLKENLLVMAGLAEQAIQRAIEAYRVRDLSICDLVSRSEIAINRMERDIDQAALDLLAMEQPMAIDLRFILSVIKINADLERVGDAAKSISDRVRIMDRMAAVDLPVDIPRMASMAADMVRKSLQAFIEGDAELARGVLTMDDAVDQMNRAAFKALTKVMEEQSHLAPQALNALMICRSLERVGDHATNIAEDVIFWVQGADVRHHKSVAKAAAKPELPLSGCFARLACRQSAEPSPADTAPAKLIRLRAEPLQRAAKTKPCSSRGFVDWWTGISRNRLIKPRNERGFLQNNAVPPDCETWDSNLNLLLSAPPP